MIVASEHPKSCNANWHWGLNPLDGATTKYTNLFYNMNVYLTYI